MKENITEMRDEGSAHWTAQRKRSTLKLPVESLFAA